MCFKTLTGLILILLNEHSSSKLRVHAITLAEATIGAWKNIADDSGAIQVFQNTQKPESAVKRPKTLVAMKPKAAIQLLESIVKSASDISQDSNQLKLCLSKFTHPEVFEQLLRCLLDYPTFDSKRKLIEVLTLVSKHATVFALNLGQLLFKLFAQVSNDLKEEDADKNSIELYLCALGELLLSTTKGIGQSENEMTNTLILPFLE